jgi:hypothetical protein
MKRFSERIDAVPSRTIQVDSVNEDLACSLWNSIFKLYNRAHWSRATEYIAEYFLKIPVDELPISAKLTEESG